MKKSKKARSLSSWLSLAKDEDNGGVCSNGGSVNSSKRQGTSSGKRSSSTAKRERPAKRRCVLEGSGIVPWYLKHSPKSVSDLAVHKKKIQEVQQWLQFSLAKSVRHPILLLTGQSGCGKTATIHALSNELGFKVVEWNDPVDSRPPERGSEYAPADWELYESQTKRFRNFIIRANRYPTLQFSGEEEGGGVVGGDTVSKTGRDKVVLVEEFPNVFIRDPKQLHQLLKDITRCLIYPLIFIVSESQHSVGTSSRLFPLHIVSEIDIHSIHFNPVSRTGILRALQQIVSAEQREGGVVTGQVSKDLIESIADCCSGDIRSAINILQFACLKDTSDLVLAVQERSEEGPEVGTSKKIKKHHQLVGVAGRDHPLFLFRALGKILYCKRNSSPEPLPTHLSYHERPRLLTDPEAVYESVQLSSDLFMTYLHQNYLDFFENIEDVDTAIGYLSDSDVINCVWTDSQDKHHSLSGDCSCSLSSRGLMFSNRHTPSAKWRPLYKPKWSSVFQEMNATGHTARETFLHLRGLLTSHLWMPSDLLTEIIPYMAVMSTPLIDPVQLSLVHSLTSFSSAYYNQRNEQLGETELDEDTVLLNSQSDSHSARYPETQAGDSTGLSLFQHPSQSSADEEFEEIEDFDD